MYESPIEIIQKDIVMKQENNIYQAILEQGIVVDKEELIRALQYDRGQYEKGFADGKAAASLEIVRCKDCKYWDVDYRYCEFHGLDYSGSSPFGEDGYCSYGERKGDE